ncbi:right-handed parallel beta-helix repeat-containing protein [Nannocystis pusilla]|uniref:Right-handed parallel beta-helix repeat-containing protein n=1 Tax=Nannocystis pusilla TaxID=889268 RepID=A0ABS7TNA4_9BACT|nr:right-handed parallel beta-helix repeat-containing protein [Nannocystis pusilla]MBZ5709713.1 right-handed parallel beta-helix repeat-containing protein [Nannocystis pusilla]
MSFRISVAPFILATLTACSTLDVDPNTDPEATAGTDPTSGTTGDGSGVDQPTTSTTAGDPTSGTTGPGSTVTSTDGPDTDGTGAVTEGSTDPTGTTTDDTTGTTTDDTTGTTTDDTTGTTTDDTTGDTDDTTTDGMGLPDDAIFVNIGVGLDSDPGTQDAPKRTIQAGISAAVMTGASAVYIAEGAYDVDYQDNKVIVLQDGVSLFGGFKADDWGVRDPALHPSVIVDKSDTGGTASQPNRALDGGTGVGPDTVVDGLTLQGGTGDLSAAVFIEGSNPTLTGNVILGGSAAFLNSYGLYVRAASPTVKRNRIEGGDHNSLSYTAAAYFGESSARVEGNTFKAGKARYTRGVSVNGSDLVFYNNVLDGGTSTNFNNAGYAHALSIINAAPVVAGNTIVTQSPTNGVGIYLWDDANPTIDGNIITRSGRCVIEDDPPFKAASIRNNAFHCTQAYESGGMTYNELLPLETLLNANGTLASGNVKVAPTFVGNGDYRLQGMGQTVCELAQGGLDQSQFFTEDHDGAPRTAPWTIGAFELDGPCQ